MSVTHYFRGRGGNALAEYNCGVYRVAIIKPSMTFIVWIKLSALLCSLINSRMQFSVFYSQLLFV